MAFVVTWEAPGLTQEQYETTLRPVLHAQPPPAGMLVHLSGPMEGGWRGITVWESQAAADVLGGSAAMRQALQTLGSQGHLTFTAWHTYDATV